MFVRLVTGRTPPNPKMEPGPPRVARGLPRSLPPRPKAMRGPPRLPRQRRRRAPLKTPLHERRKHGGDPWCRRGKSPERHSREVEDLLARRGTGGDGMRPRGRDRAPSDMVRSRSASRSVQVSLPPTPAEALARVQLLLDFPPTTGKLDEWRATIRSLVAVGNKDKPSPVEPPGRHSDGIPRTSGRGAGGAATTVHSPPPRPVP